MPPGLRPVVEIEQAVAGGASFPRTLKAQYVAQRGVQWTSNFAAVELANGDVVYAHNAGAGGPHSEEALGNAIAELPREATIVSGFSDRSLCADCQAFFLAQVRGRACQAMGRVFIYYLVPYNHGNANQRQQIIRNWWLT